MKHYLWVVMLLCPLVLADAAHTHSLPKGAIGILSVEHLTQGQLLWMKGRVGEGSYTTADNRGRHCTIKVPVAVGQMTNSGLGVDTVAGLSIIVMSQPLSDALLKGDRINSHEWQFARLAENSAADGYIVNGITAEEGFVLNSRRRWMSWLRDDKPTLRCQ